MKTALIAALGIACALALGACANFGGESTEDRVRTACTGYAAALDIASTAYQLGQLTESQAATVDLSVAVLEPVCGADADYANPALSIPQIQANMAELLGIVDEIAAR